MNFMVLSVCPFVVSFGVCFVVFFVCFFSNTP